MVTVAIEKLECGHEADGPGKAEPYLWNVFFKVDGDTLEVDFAPDQANRAILVTLDGNAEFHFSEGSHGNLGGGMGSGDSRDVPASVGTWETELEPIVVDVLFEEVELPGIVGMVSVLLEEDNVSDDGAEEGHQTLNELVEQELDALIRNFEVSVPIDDLADATDIVMSAVETHFEEGAADLEDKVSTEVEDAIQTEQNLLENLWSGVNADDFVGSQIWRVTADDIEASDGSFPLTKRWDGDHGEWTLTGSVSVPEEDDGGIRIPIGDIDFGDYKLPEGYDFGLSDYMGRVADALDGVQLVPEGFMTDVDAILAIHGIQGRRTGDGVELDIAVELRAEDASRLDLAEIQVLQSIPEGVRFEYGGVSRSVADTSHYAVVGGSDAVLTGGEQVTIVVASNADAGTVKMAFADSASDLWRYFEVEIPEALGRSPRTLDWSPIAT